MHLSSGEDWEPLSAPGPDRYVQAAMGLGEDVPLQRGDPPPVVGHQMKMWQELSSPPGERAFRPLIPLIP